MQKLAGRVVEVVGNTAHVLTVFKYVLRPQADTLNSFCNMFHY
jgi:hypothetical protein